MARLNPISHPIRAVPGATVTLTYDGFERVRTVTDSAGHTTTYDYDAFDRVTLITHPDATTEQFIYDRLDLHAHKDREGRWTRTWHNALRQPVLTADALGRMIQFQWCKCGDLKKLIDAKGQITFWKHDAQGRVYEKEYADGRKERLAYEPLSGRLSTLTDAKDQIKTFRYFPDGTLRSQQYSNLASGTAATPNVTFTYDPDFVRLATFTDGTGTTSRTYRPLGQLGALQPATIDGPLSGSTDLITYTYDALGRLKTRNIGPTGTENLTTWNYDALGRVTSLVNNLGTFNYSYVDQTSRLAEALYPNGQRTTFDYFPTNGDHRLKTIHHKANATTWFLIHDDWNLIAEYAAASSTPARAYVHGALVDEILCMITPTGTLYYHHDALGSTTALTNAQGQVVESYTYDAFGAAQIFDSSFSPQPSTLQNNRFLFTGREWLPEAGLYDYRNRVYSPAHGRFLQTDPIRFDAGDVNLYRYVSNNPVNYVDPDGRIPLPVLGFVAGAGLDIAGQLISNGGDWGNLNLGQAAVSGLAGATGAGLGAGVAKLGVGLAGRTALNALGSAAIGAGAQAGNNALNGRCLDEGLGNAALINGVLGGAGSLASDAVTGLSNSISRNLANQAFDNATLPQKLMGISNAIQSPPATGSGIGVGIANSLGVTVSNAGPLLGP